MCCIHWGLQLHQDLIVTQPGSSESRALALVAPAASQIYMCIGVLFIPQHTSGLEPYPNHHPSSPSHNLNLLSQCLAKHVRNPTQYPNELLLGPMLTGHTANDDLSLPKGE